MKNLKFLLIILFTLPLGFASCGDDDEPSQISSIKEGEIAGEGGKLIIEFMTDDWYIGEVSGSVYPGLFWGTGMSRNNVWEIIKDEWYTIRYLNDRQIEIELEENFGDYDKALKLGIGDIRRPTFIYEYIEIYQAQTSNYQIKSIEFSNTPAEESYYSATENIIVKEWINDGVSEMSISFLPLLNVTETSLFESADPEAFSWMKSNISFEVEIPMSDEEKKAPEVKNKKVYKNEKLFTPTRYAFAKKSDVLLPQGKKVVLEISEIKYCKRKYDYTLDIINKKAKDRRQIKGTWTEEVPYDYVGEYQEINL